MLALAGSVAVFSISTMNQWEPMGGPMMVGPSPRLYGLLFYVGAAMLLVVAFRLWPAGTVAFTPALGGALIAVGLGNLVEAPPFSGAFFMHRVDGHVWEQRLCPSLGEHVFTVALAGFILYAGLSLFWLRRRQSCEMAEPSRLIVVGLGGVALYAMSWVVTSRYLAIVLMKIEWSEAGTWGLLVSKPYLIAAFLVTTGLLLWKRPFLGSSLAIPGALSLLVAVCLIVTNELG